MKQDLLMVGILVIILSSMFIPLVLISEHYKQETIKLTTERNIAEGKLDSLIQNQERCRLWE